MELRNDDHMYKEMYTALLQKVEELMRDFTAVVTENEDLRRMLSIALKEVEELKSENKRLRE